MSHSILVGCQGMCIFLSLAFILHLTYGYVNICVSFRSSSFIHYPICTYMFTHLCMYICMYVHICMTLHIAVLYPLAYVSVYCKKNYTYAYTYLEVSVCTYIYMYVYIHKLALIYINWHFVILYPECCMLYTVAKIHKKPYLYTSFSAKKAP